MSTDFLDFTPKSWANNRARRKYNTCRDRKKADANGHRLRKASQQAEQSLQINGNDPCKKITRPPNILERIVGRRNPGVSLVDEHLFDIIEDKKPNEIVFTKAKSASHLTGSRWNRHENRYFLIYEKTKEDQEFEYYWKIRKMKELKNKNMEIPKTIMLKDKNLKKKKNHSSYIEKNDPNPEIASCSTSKNWKSDNWLAYGHGCKSSIKYFEDTNNKNEHRIIYNKNKNYNDECYLFLDLGKNKWITSVSTPYRWSRHYDREECIYKWKLYTVDRYSVYIGVDEVEYEKSLDYVRNGKLNNDNENNKRKIKINKFKKNNTKKKNKKRKKNNGDDIRWELIGNFNGNIGTMNYFMDLSEPFSYKIRHFVNKSTNATNYFKDTKTLMKNGKLARYIKIVSKSNSLTKKSFNLSINGLNVDKCSKPIQNNSNTYTFEKIYKNRNSKNEELEETDEKINKDLPLNTRKNKKIINVKGVDIRVSNDSVLRHRADDFDKNYTVIQVSKKGKRKKCVTKYEWAYENWGRWDPQSKIKLRYQERRYMDKLNNKIKNKRDID